MTPFALAETAARMRELVASGSYPEAEKLLEVYSRQLEACLAEDPSPGRLETLARETRELLDWSRQMASISRQQAVNQLQKLSVAESYGDRSSRHNCWRLEG